MGGEEIGGGPNIVIIRFVRSNGYSVNLRIIGAYFVSFLLHGALRWSAPKARKLIRRISETGMKLRSRLYARGAAISNIICGRTDVKLT